MTEALEAPLHTHRDGSPLLYAALSVELYLEPPEPSQVEAFEDAADLIDEWVGGELAWTHMSSFGEPEPFEKDDFSHVIERVRRSAPAAYASDPTSFGQRVDRESSGRFALVCHGGEEDWDASPTTVRYHVEPFGPAARPTWASMLRVSVPATTPLDDLRARALELASLLPVRWGMAGLSLVGWDVDHFQPVHRATYALARRHPGFDTSLHILHMPIWFERLRSVSWITLLGPPFLERLEKLGHALPQVAPAPLAFQALSNGVVAIEAPAPDPGDTNHNRVPPGYAAADRLVRPIRAASRLHFTAPWTERTTEEWLRRFEPASN